MLEFNYEAINESHDTTSGRVSAENVSAAIAQLEAQGFRVTSIQQVALETATTSPERTSPPPSEDRQALQHRIAEVLEDRDLLVPGLDAFAQELPRGRSRQRLGHFVAQLREGATAEEICKSDVQSAFWLPLLGGKSGSHRLLSEVFGEATRENESRTQWMRALIYPLFVFLASLGVFVFLCVAVVPTFTSIFRDFDLDLPKMTKEVVGMSNMILYRPGASVLAILAMGTLISLVYYLLNAWGLPGSIWNGLTSGSSRQVSTTARFTRRLADALGAELTLSSALRIAGHGVGRGRTRQVALQLASETEQDSFDLRKSPKAHKLPATVVHALQAGPEGKPSIPLLNQLAELYTERVRDRCDWSTGVVAQIAIVGMGLAVGLVVLSLFLPLVSLINGLTG